MPVKRLPPYPNLHHLRQQAKDLLKAHQQRDPQAAQRIREFGPRFGKLSDAAIFGTQLRLNDAQFTIAREYGFPSWGRLKKRVENHLLAGSTKLSYGEPIEDAAFRQAVDLLDAGDAEGLRNHLREHPDLVHRHLTFEGVNYFRNPTLLEFVAENPIRHGTLPNNIVEVAKVILDAGAKQRSSALNEALALVCSGRVSRECKVQLPLIDLLCDYGADPENAVSPALVHAEFEAVNALLRRGARVNLPVAAALGRIEDARRLLADADKDHRHRAFALASQFGHAEIVRLLLDAGEDLNRYNPMGVHSHSTALHQAAVGGHYEVVRLLVERGAKLDIRDTIWQGTPAGWARHEGRTEIEDYLRAQATKEHE